MSQVVIVDTGGANLASLRFAFNRLGCEPVVSADPAQVAAASHVVLPGVGAAREAMCRLQSSGLDRLIPGLRQPVLGICLGMQILFEHSEEDDVVCLGVFPGSVERIAPAAERPVPHMGWNRISKKHESSLLDEVPGDAYFYFLHSFAVAAGPHTAATVDYGAPLSAVVSHRNFSGTQFHPERSSNQGARLLGNFLESSPCN